MTFVNETADHAPAIEALLDRAFGPGRFVKVSERVREFAAFAPELSFCALEAGEVIGVARMWRAAVAGQPIIFLGPLAVDADARKQGLGAELTARACAAAEAAGEAAVVLVGDLPFFRKVGFEVAEGVIMPGPTDPGRVLKRVFRPVSLAGPVERL